jgi:hypothetical protein
MILARGLIGGVPDIGAQEGWLKTVNASSGTVKWIPIVERKDKDGKVIPHVKLSITPGISAAKNNRSGNPCTLCVTGVFFAENSVGRVEDFEFRVVRVTNGANDASGAHTYSGASSQLTHYWIDDVPVGEGGLQEYILQVKSTGGGKVGVFGAKFYETREESEPVSQGAHNFDSTAARTRP